VVKTEEQVITLLSRANPAPDASTLDLNGAFRTTHLAEYDARSKNMTKLKIDKSNSTLVPRRRPVIVGAVAVAVVVIGALILLQIRDQALVASDTTTPVDTAEAFFETYHGRFDVDQAFTYLGADPGAVGLGTAGAANYHLLARFFEETGSQLVDLQCEELSASPEGTVVSCTWWTHDFFSDDLGLRPFGPKVDELTIVDGKVVSIVTRHDYAVNEFSDQIWEPFADWIGENHPDDRAVMYDPYPTGWRITEESIPVWEQRLREYVAEVTAEETAEETTIGLPGLPPVGATPSTPENGELVASMWEHIGAPGSFGNGWLYLYADGRLIWDQADPNPTGGWLEQRLTPEGVELIRSEIIATGLFDPDQPPPAPNGGFPREVNGGHVQVRNGDQLVYVNRVVHELFERLAELWSWMPAGAWEDTEAKAYVPSRYAVCMHGATVAPTGGSDHLSSLPAAARDLLAGARQLHMDELIGVDPAGFAWLKGSTEYCYDITTEDARSLATTLEDGGIDELPGRPTYDGSEVTYLLSVSLEEYNGNPGITLTVWPMLPHGVPAFTGA
jgi:hypothetical protein